MKNLKLEHLTKGALEHNAVCLKKTDCTQRHHGAGHRRCTRSSSRQREH